MSEKFPFSGGIVVAGMQSSSGKTAVTCMLLAALRARGLAVQPFKVGPDFIDPGYHARYAGVPSRNLDAWLMGKNAVLREVAEHAAGKIGVIEGVMGLFDGGSASSDEGSAMELARWLNWPVLLVVPAAKAGRSLAAALRGSLSEAGEGRICGVVLNGVSGNSHTEFLREAIAPLGVPVIGAIPHCDELRWPERYLGLRAVTEMQLPADADLARLGDEFLDLDKISATAHRGNASIPCHPERSFCDSKSIVEGPLIFSDSTSDTSTDEIRGPSTTPPLRGFAQDDSGKQLKIAMARDEAFHFYYESNLDFLRERGAELIEFSPLHDDALPNEIDAVIFGGGFPEMFAPQLADNASMRASIRSALDSDLPCYAECGGLMFLAEELITRGGKHFPMVGAVPGAVEMTDKLCHFGYCTAEKNGQAFRGHEFHHSRWLAEETHANLWTLTKRRSGSTRREGFSKKNLHASYVHLFWSNAALVFDALFSHCRASAPLAIERESEAAESGALALQSPML